MPEKTKPIPHGQRGGAQGIGSQINEKYNRFVLKIQVFLSSYYGVISLLLCAVVVGFCAMGGGYSMTNQPHAKLTLYITDEWTLDCQGAPKKRNRMVKTFSIGKETGSLQKGNPGIISTGAYSTHDLTLKQFKDGLPKLTEQQAVGLGTADQKSGRIGFDVSKGEIRRNKDNFRYRKQSTFFLVDVDGIDLPTEDILKILSEIIPGFAGAGKLIVPSSSCGLYSANGKLLKNSSSLHIYFIIEDGTDAHRFMDVLFDRLWLVGHGFYMLSKAPSLLSRAIIDRAVIGAERLVYEAQPRLLDGITQQRPDPVLVEGGMVDTTLTLDLSDAEKAALEEIRQTEREKIQPTLEAAVSAKVDRIIKERNVAKDVAEKIVRDNQAGIIDDSDILYCAGYSEGIPAGQVLDNLEKFDKKTFAEPMEPSYDGGSLTKARFYANTQGEKGGKPIIHCQAHGGITYRFRRFEEKENHEQPTEQWANPEPLPDELLPVEPFDYDLLPDSLRAWVKDICIRLQCPPDFVAVGIMVAVAAVVGRKIGIGPQRNTDWVEVPNLWGLIVGRPSIMKSPALEAALGPLKKLIANATTLYNEACAAYEKESIINKLREGDGEKRAKEALKKDRNADISKLVVVDGPEKPRLRRHMTNDSSPAALGELLRHNPNGVLVYRDELVSLLKDLDKEENAGGRGFFLTGWNGNSPYTSDRIGRGMNLHIDAVCLGVLGGTQPGKIGTYIGHAVKGGEADDGLIQRFSLMVWPDNPGEWRNVDRWPDNAAKKVAFETFEYLDKLNPLDIGACQDTGIDGQPDGIPYLRYGDDALKLFNEWRQELEHRLRDDSLPPYLESHFGKYRKLIPALSLLIHLCEGGNGAVTEDPTLKALAWGVYLESHARRIYSAGVNSESKTAKTILKKIKEGSLKDGFCGADVYRPKWSMLTETAKVQGGLDMLVDYGYLRTSINEDTGGRKSTTYKIHPEYLP